MEAGGERHMLCLVPEARPRADFTWGQAQWLGQGGIQGAKPPPPTQIIDHSLEPGQYPDYLPAVVMISKVSVKIKILMIALTSLV